MLKEEIIKHIQTKLFDCFDEKYRDFSSSLCPSVDKKCFIGVRVPKLREITKTLSKEECDVFVSDLPHYYYEENLLHGFIISKEKNYETAIKEINKFLPYVNNWAVSDTMMPKIFSKHKNEVINQIVIWIKSKETYTIRFGIDCLMSMFLDEDFKEEYLTLPLEVTNSDYYVKMMVAWYYATALAKQYDSTIKILEHNLIKDTWTHNKTIQKAIESYRINDEQKKYLRALKR